MKLVITQNISLDGVVEQNEQTGEWFSVAASEADTSDINEALREMMGQETAQLYGRKTFEAMRGYWPGQTEEIAARVVRALDFALPERGGSNRGAAGENAYPEKRSRRSTDRGTWA